MKGVTPINPVAKSDEVLRLEQENSKLRKALERVHVEVFSRYIPFEIQEEIRAALDR